MPCSTSPLKQLKAFPQELVLMGRATVMIKGIAAALGLKWNLAARVRGTAEGNSERKKGKGVGS